MLGHTLRISTYNEQVSVNANNKETTTVGASMALANTAHISAKSAAIAYAALQSFSKADAPSLNLSNNSNTGKID